MKIKYALFFVFISLFSLTTLPTHAGSIGSSKADFNKPTPSTKMPPKKNRSSNKGKSAKEKSAERAREKKAKAEKKKRELEEKRKKNAA